jgi:tricorn protease
MYRVTSAGYLRYPHIHGDLLTFTAEDDVWLAPAAGGRAWKLSADGAGVSYPRFSPSGHKVAWTSWRDRDPEVYTIDAEGGGAGRLTYWGDLQTRTAGWLSDTEVLAISAVGQPARQYSWAYAVPLDGPPRRLPYGPVADLALGADGGDAAKNAALLTGRMDREPAYWKRYRGGTAGRLWTATAEDPMFGRVLADLDGQVSSPMLIGGRLAFLADHEGTGNLYSCALDGSDLRRHSDHDAFYARNAATDGRRIVYHVAGDIWILDSLDDAEPRKLDFLLGSASAARAARIISAADHLGEFMPDESGQASVVEVRGTVHWLTHADGPARALSVDPKARAREPRILGTEGKVIWVTDADGEDALEIADASGETPGTRRIAGGELGYVASQVPSPDGAHVAVAAHDGRLLIVTVETGEVLELAVSDDGRIGGLSWSPDSAWLAWSQPGPRPLARVRMARITPEDADSGEPAESEDDSAEPQVSEEAPARPGSPQAGEEATPARVPDGGTPDGGAPDGVSAESSPGADGPAADDIAADKTAAEDTAAEDTAAGNAAAEDPGPGDASGNHAAAGDPAPGDTAPEDTAPEDTDEPPFDPRSTIVDVTDGRFADYNPAFTLDGLYLAFLSRRTFDPIYDAHSFDLSFPFGIRPYLVPLAAQTLSPFGPRPGGRPVNPPEAKEGPERPWLAVDLDGISSRVVSVPVDEGRYYGLAAVKGGLAWMRGKLSGVLGEGAADADDDRRRPALERFDFRKRETMTLASEISWFEVSGDGARLAIGDGGDVRIVPADRKSDNGSSDDVINVDLTRARYLADPAGLWAHAFEEAGRIIARDFWASDMSEVDWAGVLEQYRPLLPRIRSSAEFTDLLWEVVAELGTSHAYVAGSGQFRVQASRGNAVGLLGADVFRAEDGRWLVDRVLPGESSDPLARSPLAAPGVAIKPGDEIAEVDGRPVDPVRGPWPLLAATAGKPVELTIRPAAPAAAGAADGDPVEGDSDISGDSTETSDNSKGYSVPPDGEAKTPDATSAIDAAAEPPKPRRVVVVPLYSDRRLRYQDWVAGRRRFVRERSDGKFGYLHIPDMMGEGWAHLHRDLKTEMGRDALIVDVRGNRGGHTSQLIVEKLARRIIGWDYGRYLRPESYPEDAPRGPVVALSDEFAGSDGDIVTAAIRILRLGPVVGARTWGGVIGIDGYKPLVDGTQITVPRYAFWFGEYGWKVENHGVDPDHEVLITPDEWAAGRDPQLEVAVDMAIAALAQRPPAPVPDLGNRPPKRRPPLPPRR